VARDQIIVIEQGLAGFQRGRTANVAPRQMVGDQRGIQGLKPRQPVEHGDNLGLGRLRPVGKIGESFRNRFRSDTAKL
jgi:hypothetical protein